MIKKDRNHNIDFIRGLLVISIVIIHTAFFSGIHYLPKKFINIFLFFDVPAFMFIAGLSYSYVNSFMKNIKGLLKTWGKYLFFLIFYILIMTIFFSKEFSLNEMFFWIFLEFPKTNSLRIFGDQIWFLPMYIKTTIFCTAIIGINNYFEKDEDKKPINLIKICLVIVMLFSILTNSYNPMFFDQNVLFYSIMYLLGYVSSKYKISIEQLLSFEIIDMLIWLVIVFTFGYTIYDIQRLKFPPSYPYLFVSLISIFLIWYIKDRLHIKGKNIINYLGKNALFFYFSQGISSSLLYFIYPTFKDLKIYLTFIILLIINILMAVLIGFIIERLYYLLTTKIHFKKVKEFLKPEKINNN